MQEHRTSRAILESLERDGHLRVVSWEDDAEERGLVTLVARGEGLAGPVQVERWLTPAQLATAYWPWQLAAYHAADMLPTLQDWEVPLSEVVWTVERHPAGGAGPR